MGDSSWLVCDRARPGASGPGQQQPLMGKYTAAPRVAPWKQGAGGRGACPPSVDPVLVGGKGSPQKRWGGWSPNSSYPLPASPGSLSRPVSAAFPFPCSLQSGPALWTHTWLRIPGWVLFIQPPMSSPGGSLSCLHVHFKYHHLLWVAGPGSAWNCRPSAAGFH